MKMKPARYLAIHRLEERFNQVYPLLSQERQEYGPYVFGYYLYGDGPCRHRLYFMNTQTGVLTLLEMILDRKPVERFRMVRLVIKSDLGPLGRIYPCLMSDIISESVPVENRGIDLRFLFSWSWTGNLSALRTYSRSDELGRYDNKEEIKRFEAQMGMKFPWRINMGLRADKIINLSGVIPFLDEIQANTPCEICAKTISEHKGIQLGHEYKPFIITDFFQTPCLVCGNTIQNHPAEINHKYDAGLPPHIDVLADWPEH